MKLSRIAATVAVAAIVSGCGVTHHNATATTHTLLPTVNQAAYKLMLNDFITVANLLQPGPDYGTTPQDDTAWNAALTASNIIVT